MKNKEKRTIVVTALIGVVIIGGLITWKNKAAKQPQQKTPVSQQQSNKNGEEFVTTLEDGSKVNTSEAFSKTKTLDGLEINNIQFKERGGITTLLATVQNKTSKATKTKVVKVDILDKEGRVITNLTGIVDPMPAGGSVNLNIAVSADVSNAYDFKISNASK